MIKPKVICLLGPTGAGKTAAALLLAQKLNGAVINADSRQVYADFPCITAQPSAAEQACCPHYLYGFLPTADKISAGQWVAKAQERILALQAQGQVPILVGGTGLYTKALLEGIAEIPAVDAALSARLMADCAARGPHMLHRHLCDIDPTYASRIHPNDRQRIVRALEVWEGTGKTFSWWHTHAMPEPACEGLRLGLDWDLAALTPRLVQRIDIMLAAGAVEEARAAWDKCPDAYAAGWTGIGCVEVLDFLQGRRTLDASRTVWAANTRAYAKRQLTWFRADSHIQWFGPQQLTDLCIAARNYIF